MSSIVFVVLIAGFAVGLPVLGFVTIRQRRRLPRGAAVRAELRSGQVVDAVVERWVGTRQLIIRSRSTGQELVVHAQQVSRAPRGAPRDA